MKLTRLISIVLHPVLMPLIAIEITLKYAPYSVFAISEYLESIKIIIALFTLVIPVIIMLLLIKINKITSIEMSDHKERPLPLLISASLLLIGYISILPILTFSPFLKGELVGTAIIILIASIISRYWKISLHMLAIGGVFGVLIGINILITNVTQVIIPVLLISSILGVSRVEEKAHNYTQIYTGFLIGTTVELSSILMLY